MKHHLNVNHSNNNIIEIAATTGASGRLFVLRSAASAGSGGNETMIPANSWNCVETVAIRAERTYIRSLASDKQNNSARRADIRPSRAMQGASYVQCKGL
jgi:hypothetical protein